MSQSDAHLQALAKTLSNAYYQLLQHTTQTPEQVYSKHHNDLPLSWFTSHFIDTLLTLKKASYPLEPILQLLFSWLRRTPSDNNYKVLHTVLDATLTTDCLDTKRTGWIGWVSLIGQRHDIELLKGMQTLIVQLTEVHLPLADAIHAGVAHALAQTNCLNEFELDHCQALLKVYIDWANQYRASVEQIMHAMEHVVDVRMKQKDSVWTRLVTEHKGSMASLALLAGATRRLQFEPAHRLRMKMEQECMDQFNQIMAQEDQDQDALALIAAHSLMSSHCLDQCSHKSQLIHALANTLLTHSDTFNSGQGIDNIRQLETPLFREIGRLSRALATFNSAWMPEVAQEVASLMDRLQALSYHLFFDWDQLLMKGHDSQDKAIWTYFKSFWFSSTVLLKSVAVDIPNGQGLLDLPDAAQDILSIYANLHFMTQYVEEGVAMSQSISKTKQARLIFLTDLVEQVIKHVDDQVLEEDILPVIYPVLKWKTVENQALYESAHTVIISTFVAEKPISRELAAVYATLLIKSYPDPMNLDQLRFGMTTMIQALCQLDDALAWLTVQQLIQAIDSADPVSKGSYLTVLIDLLKPLSLGPFFGAATEQVERFILAQETKEMQRATLKILFETLSQSAGISDMQKTEAIGWYLELKQKL
ncbi:hypothetical protein EDC96DRAFT_452165 [Choanephora cucurbitarum]|nr:hypothetical protein EDC96DRAFT_452165 [Choanephora cucurbitarum]